MPTPFNQSVVDEFRARGGQVGGPFEGGDLLLLTTTGARSGKRHTTPLGFVRDGDLLLVVGSNLGGPHHPDWFHNVLAHPTVTVELGTEEFEAVAVPAEGERRDRLFGRVVDAEPGYGDYQAGTGRLLPVVVLERSAHEADIPAQAAVGEAEPTRFRAEPEEKPDELTAHLDYEEESLPPILATLPWPPAPPGGTPEDGPGAHEG
ncbi:nitroreductase family deazaflavin-dependent oxidoreductase [Streptomyces sp. NPDC047123]|uniref:nitroreductase family deazaflavin-dependent oxidoreductase n=1 Tax=Streptomyces sp. NPDC047123 TaxID=3155622 RepID=UPI0033F22C32